MAAAISAARQPEQNSPPLVCAVGPIGITVSDLDRSVDFYTRVLSFERIGETEESGPQIETLTGVFGVRRLTATLQLGDEHIELSQFLAPEGRPIPADSRSNDHWFQHIAIVVSDMDAAYSLLRRHKVRHASSGPQTLPTWNPSAGGISAFYFKDPDGHVLEVIRFPNGKGDPKWQSPSDRLFLGIDHTAIVVADTDRSIAFYSGVLGLTVAGTSENYGIEQEHLNNVHGARLRITALRATSGPGIELLEYLAPSDGRPSPVGLAANDLTHWHTTLVTPSADLAAAALRTARVSWVSPGLVREANAECAAAAQVLDPDSHAVMIAQPRPIASAPNR